MTRSQRLLTSLLILLTMAGCASLAPQQEETIQITGSRAVPEALATTQISPELLKADLAIFRERLTAIHPDPFARFPATDFEAAYAQLRETLNYPLSRSEFFLQLAPLVAQLRDVHSFIDLPTDQNGELANRDETMFPLAVIVHEGKLWVAADLSAENKVPTGAQITEINNAPVEFLLRKMRSLTAMETDTGQNRKIQLDFSRLLAAMGYAAMNYQVAFQWQNETLAVDLPGLVIRKSSNEPKKASFYGYSRLSPTTSLIWLNDFNETPEKFSEFLAEKFTQMSEYRVQNLIIDVRYNQGGLSENLKNLIAFIASKPVYWANQGTIKVSENLKQNHVERTKQRRENKYSWGLQWLPLEWTDSLQHSIWWADLGETITLQLDSVQPQQNYKPNKVWVLTNGFCYSACSLFVASVNHYGLAKTMGEKVGSLADSQFVYPVSIKLPHSGLILSLPTMRLEFDAASEQPLIEPQETVKRSIEDIKNRNDPVLNKALREAEESVFYKLGKKP
ncbi:hypothetical protein FLL45_07540 [Aliikangiella marina]|uniref:Tail specific protease domain-containing protein n=1 Tax=Aliikangiella marina TaxID=1712262 RepID=A0A545TC56_9GAMM|nr:S41 family peptidase [Aliikangiella marina]TQV74805.1 hypothetical protein FLL45_07540 [Aliikangiella marina]